MKRFLLYMTLVVGVGPASAVWYWPFGRSEDDGPRLSELMYDATSLIDEATELAAEGKTQESVAKYREALEELARIEANNPDRSSTPEFTSLRNKRAYVTAAIDSLLLAEARANAKAVAITDTTELERKYLEKHGKLPLAAKPAPKKPAAEPEAKPAEKKPRSARSVIAAMVARLEKDPTNRRLRMALIGEYIKAEKFDDAMKTIEVLLKENMTDASALNLKAVCEASKGDFKAAEATLDLAIQSHPRDYNGYYNMANLKLQGSDNRDIARRYYETGRALGGPRDEALEAAVK